MVWVEQRFLVDAEDSPPVLPLHFDEDHEGRNRLDSQEISKQHLHPSSPTDRFFHAQEIIFFHLVGERTNERLPTLAKVTRQPRECILNTVLVQFSDIFRIDAVLNVEMVTLADENIEVLPS